MCPVGGVGLSVFTANHKCALNLWRPHMTRKHFIAIAEAIRNSITSAAEREAVARALVPALRAANPKFNTERFMDAVQGR